jgi:hypothetical protein
VSTPPKAPQLYRPRAAEHSVLYGIVRAHLATFLRTAAEHHEGGLPAFVEQEFRDFLTYGVWARGFARFRCEACHAERLVPFSCKGRAVCPSCGGRRMAERAAHLVDHVLPAVPIRQWVLSLPHRLRYLLAWDHALCRAVLATYTRALLSFMRRRARRQGIADGRSGAVTAIQRFGSAVNCNVHFHTLVLDGIFAPDATGALRFAPAPTPTDREVARLVATIVKRVDRLLRRRGLAPDDGASATVDPVAEDAPLLAALSRASVTGQSLLGRRPGAPVLRVGRDPDAPWVTSSGPRHAHLAGFDLHANRTVRADDRAGLQRLCQYLVRPPLAQERLALLPDGRVCCTLAHPWSDGTRALLFEPVEFLEKLAVLIPRPRINLLLYHGILAAHARGRASAVAPTPAHRDADDASAPPTAPATEVPRAAPPVRHYFAWAELLRRIFAINVLACACGGRLRFIATIEDPVVVQRILRHVGLPTETPQPAPARPPPSPDSPLAFDFPA